VCVSQVEYFTSVISVNVISAIAAVIVYVKAIVSGNIFNSFFMLFFILMLFKIDKELTMILYIVSAIYFIDLVSALFGCLYDIINSLSIK